MVCSFLKDSPSVSTNQTSYSANYGSNVTLYISLSATPAASNVYWTKTSTGQSPTNITTATAISSSKYDGVTTSNPSLTITSLTSSDSGTYVFYATNAVGTQSVTLTLNVVGGKLPWLCVSRAQSARMFTDLTMLWYGHVCYFALIFQLCFSANGHLSIMQNLYFCINENLRVN